jgi:catechol 2,3-dioxygenase-like lactoylglutathione lyase family enzyme
MRIELTSILVDNQDKAEKFYTQVLGFIKKRDIDLGEARWLTMVSPQTPDGVELVLEPNTNPAGLAYQKALFEQGIPFTAFAVDDIQREYDRLTRLGVEFTGEPADMGPTRVALFDDTCGNLIQIYQVKQA